MALASAPASANDAVETSGTETASDHIPLALMGTVPIYWGEVDGNFDALIRGRVYPHWARAALEQHFVLSPLDYLTPETLAAFDYLLMAQPRGLTPEENVALDSWVRAGGRLLLLADPMMTDHSHYPLGDRRRPQDTVLLSPILTHWGLDLLFDADQAAGLEMREFVGQAGESGDSVAIPVNLAGHFRLRDSHEDCTLNAAEMLAFCGVGAGQVTILADGALLDIHGPWPGAAQAFAALRDHAFGEMRATTGSNAPVTAESAKVPESQEKTADLAALGLHGIDEPEPPPDP